jgi:hypothetical protein
MRWPTIFSNVLVGLCVISAGACREGEPPEAAPASNLDANTRVSSGPKKPRDGQADGATAKDATAADNTADVASPAAEVAGSDLVSGRTVPAEFAPQAIEVLVDCNRATTNFGLTYHEKRFRIATGGGLDQVLRAFSNAVSRQADFIVSETPVKYCGYADRVECPSPPTPPAPDGMGPWVNVCRPFDEDRAFGGMASAVKFIGQGAASRGGIGMLLTHGLINTADNSERGGADPAQLLAGLPVRGLANALATGRTSLTLILIENVPFRYNRHGTLKLRNVGGTPVAPMAMLVWGPDDAVMADLINALVIGLEPLSPKAVRLASPDPQDLGPALVSATLTQTRAPKASKPGEPLVTETSCKSRDGRTAQCEIELAEPKTTYQFPHRDMLLFDLDMAPPQPTISRALTWRPGARPESLGLDIDATFGKQGEHVGKAKGLLIDPKAEGQGDVLVASIYPSNLPPLARCADALKVLEKTIGKIEPGSLTADMKWRRQAIIPARCIFSDEVLTKSADNRASLPSRFVVGLTLDGRVASASEVRDELDGIMTGAGWPDSNLGSETVPGLRQTVLAVGGLAIEQIRAQPTQTMKFASIEVVVK